MNENMVIHLSDEAHRKLEVSIKKALKHGLPMTQLINSGNVEDNSQNRTGKGVQRAFVKREERPARPNHQRSEQSNRVKG